MQPEHLTVPPTSANFPPQISSPQNATGRPRSGSQRSTSDNPNTDFDRRPSIRIRRAPSQQPPPRPRSSNSDDNELSVFTEGHHVGTGGRSRSNSAPQPLGLGAAGGSQRRASYMPDVAEEITSPTTGNIQEQIAQLHPVDANLQADVEAGNGGQSQVNPATVSSWRPLRRARSMIGRREETQEQRNEREGAEYESELVDILDLVGKRVLPLLHSQLTLLF
jgi:hypothetical protein